MYVVEVEKTDEDLRKLSTAEEPAESSAYISLYVKDEDLDDVVETHVGAPLTELFDLIGGDMTYHPSYNGYIETLTAFAFHLHVSVNVRVKVALRDAKAKVYGVRKVDDK